MLGQQVSFAVYAICAALGGILINQCLQIIAALVTGVARANEVAYGCAYYECD
jgi:hypothetical protein